MLTDFRNSFTGRLRTKFAIRSLLNISSHVKHVATLPCEMPMFKKYIAQELSEESCHARLNQSKQLLKKFLNSDASVIWFVDKKIHRAAILKIPQYDCPHLPRHRKKGRSKMHLHTASGWLVTDGVCQSVKIGITRLLLNFLLSLLKLESMGLLM